MTGGPVDDRDDEQRDGERIDDPTEVPAGPPDAAAGVADGLRASSDPGSPTDDGPGSSTDPSPDGRVTFIDPDGDVVETPVDSRGDPDDLDDPDSPRLPGHTDDAPPPPAEPPTRRAGTVPTAATYRSPGERNRSVYRRANPWYRRLTRGLIALCFIGALGLGIYVGARAIQDYVNRDQLPPPGPDVPPVQSTMILVTSTSSAIPLQGTLSFDTESDAFEFTGLAGTPNATDRLTSPDGETVYIVNENATWSVAQGDEAILTTVESAIAALSNDLTADAILTTDIRRGYAELVDQTEEGPESAELTRYDVALDLTAFAERYPLQWEQFQVNAIPGVTESTRHETSIWLDEASILVRVQDDSTGWNWERLSYSDSALTAFRPPPTQVIDPETQEAATGIDCRLDGLGIAWTTTLPTCDESVSVGRQLAASVGLAESADSPEAELAFASVCSALQGDEPRPFDGEAYVELAGLLVDTGVCPGDTSLVVLTTPTDG